MPAVDTVVDLAMTATLPTLPVAAAADEPVSGGAPRPIASPPASTWGTSAVLGIAACGALYVLVSRLSAESWLYGFLMSRGVLQWVMLAIALSATASLAQLSWRGRAQRKAAAALLTASESWPRWSLPEARRQVKALVGQIGEGSWAAQRLVQVVQAMASGDNSPSERARLGRSSRDLVDEQYQLARAAVGALPVVGLAATVWMLSAGMANLAAFARLASDFGSLRNMLGGFGGSLTSAFDSTLMSLILTLSSESARPSSQCAHACPPSSERSEPRENSSSERSEPTDSELDFADARSSSHAQRLELEPSRSSSSETREPSTDRRESASEESEEPEDSAESSSYAPEREESASLYGSSASLDDLDLLDFDLLVANSNSSSAFSA